MGKTNCDLEWETASGELVPASLMGEDDMYIISEDHVTDEELIEWAVQILVDSGQLPDEARDIAERSTIFHTFAQFEQALSGGDKRLVWPATYEDLPVTVMELW